MVDAPSRRLASQRVERAGASISFTFEGETITAIAGESLAAALTAAGHMGLRQAGPTERRGLYCGMGACQDCLVEVDGRGSQRACMAKAADGLAVRRHDPNTSTLAPLAARPPGDLPLVTCDVALVGAGPAALAAARLLGEAGLNVILLDERDQPGGQYFKPLAPSHRFRDAPSDAQFAERERIVGEAVAAGVDMRFASLVWQASLDTAGKPELAVHGPDGAYTVAASAVILAPGAYEKPHHIPGWTLPGVMTSGSAQTLARSYRVAPGQAVLVAGNGPLNWQVAIELARGGANVSAIVESARPSRLGSAAAFAAMAAAMPSFAFDGLAMRAELLRRRIPIIEGAIVTAIEGRDRVECVHVSRDDGSTRSFDVDTVSLGYGFIPATELLRQLGGAVFVNPQTVMPVPVLSASGRSGKSSVWVAGDGAGIRGSQMALARGRLAAADVIAALGRPAVSTTSATLLREKSDRFQDALWTLFKPTLNPPAPSDDTIICRCENITAGTVRSHAAAGVNDLASLKRLTRLGMGRCQGRYCAGAALAMLRPEKETLDEADLFAPQAPARPVPAMALAVEKGEWGGHREVPTQRMPRGAHAADLLPVRCDLLVIGAGITGSSTAMFAARAGMDVVVIDRRAPNGEASGGNAGSLHVQLLSWDFGKKAMKGGSPAQRTLPLQRDSVELWKQLERDLAADFEIVTTGGLMVAEDEAQAEFLAEKAASERAVGIDTRVIDRSELASLAPAIAERMVVAAYCPAEGKINPLKATPAIVAEAQRHGARFFAGHQVNGVEHGPEGYRVNTAAGASIVARRLVIAAGGWSRHIGRLLDVELPISGAPLQMLVTEPTRPILKQLVAHADRHLTMKQASNGNLIIGGAWTATADPLTGRAHVLRSSIEGNLWVAERTLPQMSALHLLRSWAAMNINIDGAPLLGPLPGHPDVFVAATANGYTLGPIMGRITAGFASGEPVGPDLEYFTLRRFN